MTLEEAKRDLIVKQKKGLPFILSSVIIWALIALVFTMDTNIQMKNLLTFCSGAVLLPLAWIFGKKMGVDIFEKSNSLGQAGLIFTMNQVLYLLIVMWVFSALPEKMVMVFAMVFGAHLLPYSWLYDSRAYLFAAVLIPILSLILGNIFSSPVLALVMVGVEIIFVLGLLKELKTYK